MYYYKIHSINKCNPSLFINKHVIGGTENLFYEIFNVKSVIVITYIAQIQLKVLNESKLHVHLH